MGLSVLVVLAALSVPRDELMSSRYVTARRLLVVDTERFCELTLRSGEVMRFKDGCPADVGEQLVDEPGRWLPLRAPEDGIKPLFHLEENEQHLFV